MEISFTVRGYKFNAIDYLTHLQHLPPNYDLWEFEKDFDPQDGNGFTITFPGQPYLYKYPFALKKFLVANRHFLSASLFEKVNIEKEISVRVFTEDLPILLHQEMILYYELKPWFIKILGELDIRFKIGKYQ